MALEHKNLAVAGQKDINSFQQTVSFKKRLPNGTGTLSFIFLPSTLKSNDRKTCLQTREAQDLASILREALFRTHSGRKIYSAVPAVKKVKEFYRKISHSRQKVNFFYQVDY